MKQKKDYIYSNQSSLWGKREIIGFGSDDFYIKEVERLKANGIIIKNHYSHKVYNATYIHLGVYYNNLLKGILQYGYAMNPASCSSVVKDTDQDEYLELNRMWIDDDCGLYPESKAISYSIKYIRGKFPKIKWIQSFADERCGGYGIVYQACSFKYYGEHTSDFWEYKDTVYHNIQMTVKKGTKSHSKEVHELQSNKDLAKRLILRQFRYIKFLDQRKVKDCLLKEKHYPKHYNEISKRK